MAGKLTGKRAKFVLEYLKDLNATQAALRAGYAESGAHQEGHRLLKDADVAAAIAERQAKHAAKAELTVDYIVTEFRQMAEARLADIVDIEALTKQGKIVFKKLEDIPPAVVRCIKVLKQTEHGIHIELFDQENALAKLGQHLGWIRERVEHSADERLQSALGKLAEARARKQGRSDG